jgi:hypothetical protein
MRSMPTSIARVAAVRPTLSTGAVEGRFSKAADGTPLVKTESGHVAIIAGSAQLASLKVGDAVRVEGQRANLAGTTNDAYSGPAVEATSIARTRGSGVAQRMTGTVTRIGAQPGYPSGAFLRLARPVKVEGQVFSLVSLPGRFATNSYLGAELTLSGRLAVDTSPAGLAYVRFEGAPKVISVSR